jgi:hypothetical protein
MNGTHATALALAVTTLVAGCGNTASTKQTIPAATSSAQAEIPAPAKAVSRAQLIASADAICRGIQAKRAQASHANQSIATEGSRDIKYLQLEYTELARLTPPQSLATDWKRIVADSHAQAVAAARLVEYAEAHRLGQAGSILSQMGNAEHRIAAIAERDGFHACAQLA